MRADGTSVGHSDRKRQSVVLCWHYVINPQFDEADSFSDGLAAVLIDYQWGFIAR